jgi:hypothetical protein
LSVRRGTIAAVGIAALALFGLPGSLGSPVHVGAANTCTWTGGTGTTMLWSDPANWSTCGASSPAVAAGDTLNFPSVVSPAFPTSNNDIAANTIFAAINFTGTHSVTAGNALGVNGSITSSGAGSITPAVALSGPTPFPISGAGTLSLGAVSGNGIGFSGPGTLTLGTDTGGAVTVSGGTLSVTGSTSNAVTVSAGTLSGTGTITGIIMNGGTLSAGLHDSSTLSLGAAAIYSAAAGTTTAVTGAATLAAGTTLAVPSAGASPTGSPFTILTAASVTGTFSNPGGIVDSPTRRFSISYTATSVVLTDIGATGAIATTTTLLPASNPSANPPFLTALVTALRSPSCVPSPTCPAPFGNVTFFVDGVQDTTTLPNPVTLVATNNNPDTATAVYTPTLTPGGHTITATYNTGNPNVFTTSSAVAIRELVLAAALPPSPTPAGPSFAPQGAFISPATGLGRAIASATVDNTVPTILLGSDNARAVTLTIPAGALPNGTSVAIYAGERLSIEPLLPPPAGQSYFMGAGITWQAPDGSTPAMASPASVTMVGAGIAPGAFFYQTTATGLVPLNVTFGLGFVTVPITTDPGFVITGKPPSPQGYWMVARDGGIFPFGTAPGYGSTGNLRLNAPIVAMCRTPDGLGYWLVASDGGIFPFGSAHGIGSLGGLSLNAPIVGMASTPAGFGYWLVGSDGGVFPFGSAKGYGSMGDRHLNKPIVAIVSTHSGHGYWLVASDGGIFPFGDAGGFGSTGGITLNQPIVGMERTSDDGGYWMVASDGGIFPFGDAQGYGSTGNLILNQPIVGMAATVTGKGYWLAAADGGLFPFGAALGVGSLGGIRLNQPIVGIAVEK